MNKSYLQLLFFSVIALSTVIFYGCAKNVVSENEEPEKQANNYRLTYGDSILYIKNTLTDYKISPQIQRKGHYTVFPEGLDINESTGDITIARDNDGLLKSETGLRYRISFEDDNGTKENTFITLSGINYADHFYHLSQGDSIAYPIYNNMSQSSMPCIGSECIFDEENTANSSGCVIKVNSGQINLAQTVRNGLFGIKPENTKEPKEVIIKYRLNDNSGRAINGLKVLLYYYNSINDVPEYLNTILNERQEMFLRVNTNSSDQRAFKFSSKPRPPCIIIVGK
jgi:hypothetical protein